MSGTGLGERGQDLDRQNGLAVAAVPVSREHDSPVDAKNARMVGGPAFRFTNVGEYDVDVNAGFIGAKRPLLTVIGGATTREAEGRFVEARETDRVTLVTGNSEVAA